MEDDNVTPELSCNIELEFSGPTDAVMHKWCADVLRRLADAIEKDELGDGVHELKDGTGKQVGRVDLMYSGYAERV